MFTKHVLAVAAATMLAAGAAYAQDTATPEHPKGEVNRRLENQHDRIEAGEADGQLTKGEASRLERHDKRMTRRSTRRRSRTARTTAAT